MPKKKIRFFHIPILHLLRQTFASTLHNALSHAQVSAKFALPVPSAFCFQRLAQNYIPTLMPFRMVHLSLQTYHILLFNSKALLCGNFPMAGALRKECARIAMETVCTPSPGLVPSILTDYVSFQLVATQVNQPLKLCYLGNFNC